jgi:hypothetical protein
MRKLWLVDRCEGKKCELCNLAGEFQRLLAISSLLRAIGREADFMDGVSDRQMKNMLRITSLLLIAVGALMLFQRPAYAYTDPGTGLLAIQAAGSAVIATGWYLRRKIYVLFHRKAAVEQSPEHPLVRKDETSSLS